MLNFFKPKKQARDYTVSMLPHNRKEVFFDVFKLHWFRFLTFGLLILLFASPMLMLSLIEDSYNAGVMENFDSLSAEEQAAAYYEVISMSNTKALLNIFSFLLLSVCMAGLVRIVRQYGHGENVFFGSDFSKGIKQNLPQTLLLGLLVGVFNAFGVFAYNLSLTSESEMSAGLFMIPVGLTVLIGIPAAAYTLVCISLYNNRFIQNLKIGLMMTAKAPFKTLLALLCCFAPFIPQLIPNIYFHIFGGIIGALLSPFVMLGWFLFASNTLDKYINKEHYPSLVGRGIFKDEQSEEL